MDENDPHAESKEAVRQFKADFKKLSAPEQAWNVIVIAGVIGFFGLLLVDAVIRSFFGA